MGENTHLLLANTRRGAAYLSSISGVCTGSSCGRGGRLDGGNHWLQLLHFHNCFYLLWFDWISSFDFHARGQTHEQQDLEETTQMQLC